MKNQIICLFPLFLFLLLSKTFPQNWINYTNGDNITAIEIEGNYVWVGTAGGLVKIDRISEEKTFYNKTNSGLPDNKVSCIAIDNEGNKWIGTGGDKSVGGGLAKFDDTNWTVYDTSNSGLPANYVSCIAIDDDGNKWIGSGGYVPNGDSETVENLVKFDGVNWTVYSASVLTGHPYSCIEIDSAGNKWMGASGRLLRFDGTVWYVYSIENSGLPGNDIYDITIDDEGNKWIGTNAGLAKLRTFHWTVYNTSNSELPDNNVSCITIDDDGNKWIGGRFNNGALIKFNDSTWTVYDASNSELPGSGLSCIAIDDDGEKWIGTGAGHWWGNWGDGLVRFDDNNWTRYNTSNSNLTGDGVWCIAIDDDGNKWFGNHSYYYMFGGIGLWGDGLLKFDGKVWTVYNTLNSELPDDYLSCIAIDNEGNKWIGTREGLAKYDDINWTVYNTSNTGLPNNNITSIAIDNDGTKWIGAGEPGYGGLAKFNDTIWTVYDNENSDLSSNGILCIAIDDGGNKWLGTWDGLVKFDGTDWTIYNFENSGLPGGSVSSIAIDDDGNKWIGVKERWGSGGLTKFDGTNWTIYDKSNSGLPSNYGISEITIDDKGNIWICTAEFWRNFEYGGIMGSGLIQFDGTIWTVYNSSNSGLSDNYVSSVAIDKFNNKWIGSLLGLSVFNETIVSLNETKNIQKINPNDYLLSQNYPNPFNPKTIINYELPARSAGGAITNWVELSIYNLLGQKVATLVNKKQAAGPYKVEWDASGFSSGVYLYRLSVRDPLRRTGGFTEIRKMVLLK